ncbi:hypothetical protein STEG23_025854, partial [Scotinomys teguina]
TIAKSIAYPPQPQDVTKLDKNKYSKIKSILLKLDFGIGEYINQKKCDRVEADKEKSHKDGSELDFSALCPKICPTVAAKELSLLDTDVSSVSWADNGTFNVSEEYPLQTDTSDDLDQPSEEVFSQDLPDLWKQGQMMKMS